jgi:hypothetical protein
MASAAKNNKPLFMKDTPFVFLKDKFLEDEFLEDKFLKDKFLEDKNVGHAPLGRSPRSNHVPILRRLP